eukprot:m.188242 g.188242  ORF g.188242 m.188242 type:complete len:554 (+) comp10023_c0_seq3:339-2000(+)
MMKYIKDDVLAEAVFNKLHHADAFLRSLAVNQPATGYFVSAPGAKVKGKVSSPQDVAAALANLFKPAAIVDHPTVMEFYRGLGQAPTDVADKHTTFWGKCDWGLYAMRAPLVDDSVHGFLAALRILIPDAHDADGWPVCTWGREITIRHPIDNIPKSVGGGLGASAGDSDKSYKLDAVLWMRHVSSQAPSKEPGAPYIRPAILVECAVRGRRDKPLQLQKYAMNVTTDLFSPDDAGCILAITVIFDGLGPLVALKVDAYWQTPFSGVVGATRHRCLAASTLVNIEGMPVTRGQLQAVFNGLYAALVRPQQPLPARLCGVSQDRQQRLCIADNYVYKYFNNLGRKTEADIVRSAVVWVALSRCDLVAGRSPATKAEERGQVIIIRYRFIAGSHIATTVAQFVDVINDLQAIHEAGFCHADVREANILFAPAGAAARSQFIDFDLSGRADIDTYPPRYYPIPDGKRHAAAQPYEVMAMAHDRFSLAAIMQFYQPDDACSTAWTEAVRVLPLDQGLTAARGLLQQYGGCHLVRIGGPDARLLRPAIGSGSPHDCDP